LKRLVLTALSFCSAAILVLGTVGSALAAQVLNEQVPVDGTITNDCNGEQVAFQGFIHIREAVTTDASGGQHISITENGHDITGVGLTTGAKYVIPVALHEDVNVNGNNPENNVTLTETLDVLAQGKVPNFKIKVLQHVTINANGEITSMTSEFETSCR
jgi:hypothetical protein